MKERREPEREGDKNKINMKSVNLMNHYGRLGIYNLIAAKTNLNESEHKPNHFLWKEVINFTLNLNKSFKRFVFLPL